MHVSDSEVNGESHATDQQNSAAVDSTRGADASGLSSGSPAGSGSQLGEDGGDDELGDDAGTESGADSDEGDASSLEEESSLEDDDDDDDELGEVDLSDDDSPPDIQKRLGDDLASQASQR